MIRLDWEEDETDAILGTHSSFYTNLSQILHLSLIGTYTVQIYAWRNLNQDKSHIGWRSKIVKHK